MKLPNLIQRLFAYFRSEQQPPIARRPTEPENPQFTDDLPPGYVPIETQISGQDIDGTCRWVGQDARVVQAPSGELITCQRVRGVRCGCGHIVYAVQEKITETGVLAGIGAECGDCSREAEDLVKRNAISAFQAEAMALYCSRCASRCDSCGRHNLCSRHARLFTDAAGEKQLLCPDCLRKAGRKKLFKQTLATMAWLLSEDDRSSKSSRPGDPYDY
jgi:hypothetical protein